MVMTEDKQVNLDKVMAVIDTMERPCPLNLIAKLAGVPYHAALVSVELASCFSLDIKRHHKAPGVIWFSSRSKYRQLLPAESIKYKEKR